MKTEIFFETITNKIINELKEGTAPWTKPWFTNLPINAVSAKNYNGINILALTLAAEKAGYKNKNWLTYKQATDLGGNVKKGEKGTAIIYAKKLLKKDENEKEIKSFLMRCYYVFNVEQCEKLPEHFFETETKNNCTIESAEAFVFNTEAKIVVGGNQACYAPDLDLINMPELASFDTSQDYYSTLFHELGHWTGHYSRLNRDLKGRFKSESYAAEELIAEMTSAFLCAFHGFNGKLQHASYIQSWIKILQNDPKALMTAASKASQAANYLGMGKIEEDEEENEEEREAA